MPTKQQIVLAPQMAAVLTKLRQRSMTTLQITRATGIMRVGSVIHLLRTAGHHIDTTLVAVKTRYANHCAVALYTLRRGRGRPATVRVKQRSQRRHA